MIEETKVHMKDGVADRVEGRYFANGRTVRIFRTIEEGQTARSTREAMREEASKKLGLTPA